MRLFLISSGLAMFLALVLEAAPPAVRTRPAVPDQTALNHLGLKRRWFTYVPMDGTRDRILFAQFLGDQLVLQTAGGRIMALAGETGETQVQISLGRPFQTERETAAANASTLFVAVDTTLYGIERYSGRRAWTMKLPRILSTGPTVDGDRLFICTRDGALHAYRVPVPDRPEPAGEKTPLQTLAEQALLIYEPLLLWHSRHATPISPPPVAWDEQLIFADPAGVMHLITKKGLQEQDTYALDAPVTGPFGQSDAMVFAAARDTNLYGFEIGFNRLQMRWRTVVGGKVIRKPLAIGDDVYAAPIGVGLVCLDSQTGDRRWQFPGAEECIAAGRRMVFAADRHGDVLLLDRQKGKLLGKWPAHDFAFRVPNESNDRLYLVNHDGLVVCLHDSSKAHDQPLMHKLPPKKPVEEKKEAEPEKAAEEKPPPKAGKKEEEK